MNRRKRTRAGLKNRIRLHAGLICRFTAGKDAVPCVPSTVTIKLRNLVGRVTPCAPQPASDLPNGAHAVTRPTQPLDHVSKSLCRHTSFRLHAGLVCRFTRPSDSSPSPLPKGRGPGVRGPFAIFGVARCPAPGVFCLFAFCLFTSLAFAQEKITYQDHILPLVEANCSKCHNADKKKADLELTSYQGALKGSGSGLVLLSGNLDGSKLWKALTHSEEPFMPPNRPKLDDKDLEKFKKWILGGLLETASGKA